MTDYDGFVYEWTNIKNNKKYIGSHLGTTDDGYIGSGIYFLRSFKKSPDRFVRTILEFVKGDRATLLQREQHYLNSIPDIANNKNYYNVSPNAGGGYNHGHLTDQERTALYQNWVNASKARLASMSTEERDQLKAKKQQTWSDHIDIRQQHAEKTKLRRLQEEALKSDQEKEEFKQKMQTVYWSRSVEEIKSHHDKQSSGVKKWHQTKSAEVEQQRVSKMAATKQQLRLKYIHHPGSLLRKQIPFEEMDSWLQQGWQKGMGPKNLGKV